MNENVRKSLEQCDVDADIELFVTTKRTGSERPGEGMCPQWLQPTKSFISYESQSITYYLN